MSNFPGLQAFADAIETQEQRGGSDLNAIVTATARAIFVIEKSLAALEEDVASRDDGDWNTERMTEEEIADEEAKQLAEERALAEAPEEPLPRLD